MPDGAQVSFPDDMPAEQIKSMILQKFPDAATIAKAPADDHGKARRSEMSVPEKIASPITEYPAVYAEMNKEARDQMSRGVGQLGEAFSEAKPLYEEGGPESLWKGVKGAGNLAGGALGYVFSPVSAAYRTQFGNPVEDLTGIPREYTEFATQLATPGIGFGRMPAVPGAPVNPANFQPVSAAPMPAQAAPNELAAAAGRLAEMGSPVDVPRAIASDNMAVQRSGQAIRNLPIIGDAIPKATIRLGDQLETAAGNVAADFGGGSGPNVAHNIGQTIGSGAEQEAIAARAAAQQIDNAVLAGWERAYRDANDAIVAHEGNSLAQARRAVGDMSPQDMGEVLTARLRRGEREARAEKERLYNIAGSSDGAIESGAVRRLRADVENSLNESGGIIDPVLTPAASRMMAELDNAPLQLSSNMARRPDPLPREPIPQPIAPQAGAEAVSKGPQAPQGQSLLEFLASKGGLGPDAELGAIGAQGHIVNVTGAGRRRLVRQGGLPLDYAREAAQEAGYLRGQSTPRDLLDAIDAEMRGQKRFAEGFEGTVSKRDAAAQAERSQYEYDRFRHGLEQDLAEAGHTRLGPDVKDRALKLMESEKLDANAAVKRAFQEAEQEDAAIRKNFPSGQLPPDPAVSMQAMEQTRKRLNSMAQAATNDADRRAARMIIKEYDNWLGDAFDNKLFSGSEDALNAFRSARAANTEWRQRYGYNARDDADRVVNRIVTGEVTPQEVANYVIGATKVGSKGVSSRLLTRITEATGGDPEAMNAIRGGVWNRLSQATEGATAKSAEKVATDINEFLHGSGRDVANRLFTESQRSIMRTYAQTIREGEEARATVADMAANTRPSSMDVGVGPFQKLANDVLGKNGRSDEALYSAINSYAKSGARGDINLLSKILQAVPQADRGNLASAMIRDMGVSPRTGQFSPDVFVSTWGTYRPEAKAMIFGMTGPQRLALDDIAKISQRMKEVGTRFGNPSGTAQNANFLGLAGGFMAAPLSTLAGAIGGAVTAKVLASPVGASSTAKWAKAYEIAATRKTEASAAALGRATSLLALNISRDTGMPMRDIIQRLQGPMSAGAQGEQVKPGREGQQQPYGR